MTRLRSELAAREAAPKWRRQGWRGAAAWTRAEANPARRSQRRRPRDARDAGAGGGGAGGGTRGAGGSSPRRWRSSLTSTAATCRPAWTAGCASWRPKLEPGRDYEVALVGSVGNGDVEGKSAEEALRYNRWMAERRVSRVAEFLQKTAKAGELEIRQDFALNDPSRRVLVEIRPLAD